MDRVNQFDPESDVCDASKPSHGPSEYICMNVHRRMAEGLLSQKRGIALQGKLDLRIDRVILEKGRRIMRDSRCPRIARGYSRFQLLPTFMVEGYQRKKTEVSREQDSIDRDQGPFH